MKPGICVVTVTYGDRQELLRKVIEKLKQIDIIERVIVVENGSNYHLESDDYTKVIRNKANLGSAKGFKQGIEAAIKLGMQYIWLLDDDNVPQEGALSSLVRFHNTLEEKKEELFALVSLREDRKDFVEAAASGSYKGIFPKKNSFFGLHLVDLPKKLIKKVIKKEIDRKDLKQTTIPYSYYSGLFFKSSLIKTIGLPEERFFLYSDDFEFTHRINANGGKLYLVPESRLVDIDQSWFVKTSFLKSLFNSSEDRRIYYSIRNRISFERNGLKYRGLVYLINRFIFLSLVKVISQLKGKKLRYLLIKKAINDGESNKLGKNNNI
ncbi:glycosyltransferase [Terribacillus saccharophilus]|uniref:glycosyltransferase n=1 Tax=Terribacillus saccharophilus TaxID=361277 RepID=UPI002989AE3F|nr:glycosyltransferase [Terribacillus saccharophilus]MCM3225245.1 glycosyltransferase [Terribacillus saccharophilus]